MKAKKVKEGSRDGRKEVGKRQEGERGGEGREEEEMRGRAP